MLKDWHNAHIDYYNKRISKIVNGKHKGLNSLVKLLEEVVPSFKGRIVARMMTLSGDLSVINEKEKGNLIQNFFDGVDAGDDNSCAICYWMKYGDGFEHMFLIIEEAINDSKISRFGLGIVTMLLKRYQKALIHASVKSGIRTRKEWLEWAELYEEIHGRNLGVHEMLGDLDFPVQATVASAGESSDSIQEERHIRDNAVRAPEGNHEIAPIINSGAKTPHENQYSQLPLFEKLICDNEVKPQVIDFIKSFLTHNPKGDSIGKLFCALENKSIFPMLQKQCAEYYAAVEALHIEGLVKYRQFIKSYGAIKMTMGKTNPDIIIKNDIIKIEDCLDEFVKSH